MELSIKRTRLSDWSKATIKPCNTGEFSASLPKACESCCASASTSLGSWPNLVSKELRLCNMDTNSTVALLMNTINMPTIKEPNTPNNEALKATPMARMGSVKRDTSSLTAATGSVMPEPAEKEPISLPISCSAPNKPMKVPNRPKPTIMPDMNCANNKRRFCRAWNRSISDSIAVC